MIVVYLMLIAVVLRALLYVVLVREDGPILWIITAGHGLHVGDIPAIVLGGALIPLLMRGIGIEMKKLACRR